MARRGAQREGRRRRGVGSRAGRGRNLSLGWGGQPRCSNGYGTPNHCIPYCPNPQSRPKAGLQSPEWRAKPSLTTGSRSRSKARGSARFRQSSAVILKRGRGCHTKISHRLQTTAPPAAERCHPPTERLLYCENQKSAQRNQQSGVLGEKKEKGDILLFPVVLWSTVELVEKVECPLFLLKSTRQFRYDRGAESGK